MNKRTNGTNARAWFAGQSFNGRLEEQQADFYAPHCRTCDHLEADHDPNTGTCQHRAVVQGILDDCNCPRFVEVEI